MKRLSLLPGAALLALTVMVVQARADDWPQILGPQRNGEAAGEKLLEEWPEGGPEKLWNRPCGQGFAGVAVQNDRVYLFHRLKSTDLVECLSAETGENIWKTEFKSIYRGGYSSDLGPRCVPLVHGDSLFCYGAAGTLRRLSLESGEPLWSKNLFEEFQANEGYFGAGSAPIIVDDTIVVIVGGRKAGIVALDLNGETVWTTKPDTASYSAPVQLTFQDKACVACVSKYYLRIVEVSTGIVLAEQEFGERGATVNAALPLVFDNRLFITASYNIGGRMLTLPDLKTVWENDLSMSSQYTTSIVHDGHLIGSHGREDYADGVLRCVRVNDGKVVWADTGSGLAHLIKVGDLGLVWCVSGKLKLIRLRTDKFDVLEETRIFDRNCKSLPALSNGRLFLKSNGEKNDGELICLRVGS